MLPPRARRQVCAPEADDKSVMRVSPMVHAPAVTFL